jgi:hypothetical protein
MANRTFDRAMHELAHNDDGATTEAADAVLRSQRLSGLEMADGK